MLKIRLPIPRFLNAEEIFFDKGSLGVLKALEFTRAFVLVSKSLYEIEEVKKSLHSCFNKKDVKFFMGPTGEPVLEKLKPLFYEVGEFRPDWIIAIGGGSVIDAAKIAWIFYEHPDLDLERALRPGGLPSLRGKAKFAAIPSTAGTGSEVSSSCVFLNAQTGRKHYFVSHELLPDLVILDPEVTQYMPSRVTAISGFDALTHAIEGYVSRFKNPFLDSCAEQALREIFQNLENCVHEPRNLNYRMKMMNAALLSGWVQNLKLPGLGHAIAHQLGEYKLAHGHASAIFLPISIQINSEDKEIKNKYLKLAEQIGCKSIEQFISKIEELFHKLGLENKLTQAIHGQSIDQGKIVEGALKDVCAQANPTKITESTIFRALEMAG